VLAVIILASIIIVTALYVTKPSDAEREQFPEFALQIGDCLNYTMTGENATGEIRGSAQITIINITMLGTSPGSLSTYFNVTPSLTPYPSSNMLIGPFAYGWYGRDVVQTVFGEKHVDKFIQWDSGLVIIAFIGSESGIGYRLVAANDSLSSELDLAATNVADMTGRDNNEVIIDRYIDEPPEGGANVITDGGDSHYLFSITRPAQFYESRTGNGSVFYLFSPSNLTAIENGGPFEYAPSTVSSGGSTLSLVLEPGIYFWVFDASKLTDSLSNNHYNLYYL
jgi:hypothetical protein